MRHQSVNQKDFGVQKKTRHQWKGTRIYRIERISKLCLEGNTERSESNPGRSLGTTDKRRAAVWKTVPTYEL